MYPDFFLQQFRFHLQPKVPLHLPAYNKGNVIRGGFGSTFRRIVCHASCREPETCELRNVCPYVAVFHPFVPQGSEKLSANRDIPRPFVIKPPLDTREIYPIGGRLSFDIVLVGKSAQYLPYFVVTFKELCQLGLGRNRAPLELLAVDSLGEGGEATPVYRSQDNMVRPPRDSLTWESSEDGNPNGPDGRGVTLRFLTPTMLKADGMTLEHPTFGAIAKRLRDRINALSYFYCGKGLDIDFKGFGVAADKIRTVEDRTRWIDSSRYSRRRQVFHDLGGFVGEASFEGDLAPFLPYLRLGQYLHVGKNAVFGNGWYEIVEMS